MVISKSRSIMEGFFPIRTIQETIASGTGSIGTKSLHWGTEKVKCFIMGPGHEITSLHSINAASKSFTSEGIQDSSSEGI